MKREDCWMTFSEALESYLAARERVQYANSKGDFDNADARDMKVAADHMDALTTEQQHG